ncbi:hypothetical protein K402DRAFT_306372, partial [Aulographum hederae CBS 113979]
STMADQNYPPFKRQRTDGPGSPYYSSPNGYLAPPLLSPAAPQASSLPSFHSPQPFQPAPNNTSNPSPAPPGAMGPPERPAQNDKAKSTDVNDLSDLLSMGGVNLAEEEALLANIYRYPGSQNTAYGTSFASQTSSTMTPNGSFNAYSQGDLKGALPGTGPLSQPASTQEAIETENEKRHKQAARELAEIKSKHLNKPFLQAECVRRRMDRIVIENKVRTDINGVFEKNSADTNNHRTSTVLSKDENEGILMTRSTWLNETAKLVDILTLISLATRERLRSVLEDSFAIARSRQTYSNGTVPPEWSSLAVGDGVPEPTTAVPQSITNTAWDKVPESAISPGTLVSAKQPAP